ncbi:unnamed protein product [Amoebophrya sp. A120]|nr:unnamed protein product [Amoebophrya sp. A120]|eukprot:GSA120T00024809001.1
MGGSSPVEAFATTNPTRSSRTTLNAQEPSTSLNQNRIISAENNSSLSSTVAANLAKMNNKTKEQEKSTLLTHSSTALAPVVKVADFVGERWQEIESLLKDPDAPVPEPLKQRLRRRARSHKPFTILSRQATNRDAGFRPRITNAAIRDRVLRSLLLLTQQQMQQAQPGVRPTLPMIHDHDPNGENYEAKIIKSEGSSDDLEDVDLANFRFSTLDRINKKKHKVLPPREQSEEVLVDLRTKEPENVEKSPNEVLKPFKLLRCHKRRDAVFSHTLQLSRTSNPENKTKWLGLATHVWHAKRFHMETVWGWRLPKNSCEIGARAVWRKCKKQGLVLHDRSYARVLKLSAAAKKPIVDLMRDAFGIQMKHLMAKRYAHKTCFAARAAATSKDSTEDIKNLKTTRSGASSSSANILKRPKAGVDAKKSTKKKKLNKETEGNWRGLVDLRRGRMQAHQELLSVGADEEGGRGFLHESDKVDMDQNQLIMKDVPFVWFSSDVGKNNSSTEQETARTSCHDTSFAKVFGTTRNNSSSRTREPPPQGEDAVVEHALFLWIHPAAMFEVQQMLQNAVASRPGAAPKKTASTAAGSTAIIENPPAAGGRAAPGHSPARRREQELHQVSVTICDHLHTFEFFGNMVKKAIFPPKFSRTPADVGELVAANLPYRRFDQGGAEVIDQLPVVIVDTSSRAVSSVTTSTRSKTMTPAPSVEDHDSAAVDDEFANIISKREVVVNNRSSLPSCQLIFFEPDPAKVRQFFLYFKMECLAEVIGFEDRHRLRTAYLQPEFPFDFPETRAGTAWLQKREKEKVVEFIKKPKSKRVNYAKFKVHSPFYGFWPDYDFEVDAVVQPGSGEAAAPAGHNCSNCYIPLERDVDFLRHYNNHRGDAAARKVASSAKGNNRDGEDQVQLCQQTLPEIANLRTVVQRDGIRYLPGSCKNFPAEKIRDVVACRVIPVSTGVPEPCTHLYVMTKNAGAAPGLDSGATADQAAGAQVPMDVEENENYNDSARGPAAVSHFTNGTIRRRGSDQHHKNFRLCGFVLSGGYSHAFGRAIGLGFVETEAYSGYLSSNQVDTFLYMRNTTSNCYHRVYVSADTDLGQRTSRKDVG